MVAVYRMTMNKTSQLGHSSILLCNGLQKTVVCRMLFSYMYVEYKRQ